MLQRVAWCGHVVKLYETFKVNSEAHLIMELCAGGTLRDLMQREGGRLPSSTAARVLQALSEFARACLQEGNLKQFRLPPTTLSQALFCKGSLWNHHELPVRQAYADKLPEWIWSPHLFVCCSLDSAC